MRSITKYIILSIVALSGFSDIFAQHYEINVIGGFSANGLARFEQMEGGGSYEGEGGWQTGLKFSKKLSVDIRATTGLVYSQHLITIFPEYFPDIEMIPRSEKLKLLSVPFEMRLDFLKYFLINAGPSLDIDISNKDADIDSQSGLGLGMGFGGFVQVKKFTFQVNPYLKIYALLPFKRENHHQHLVESGISLSVGYAF